MQLLRAHSTGLPARKNGCNPRFLIMDIPAKTVSLVLIATHPKTEMFHWVVYNIPATNVVDEYFSKGNYAVNDFGRHDYIPPKLWNDSRLVFTLFALDCVLNIGGGKGGNDILKAIKGHIFEYAITEYRFTDDSQSGVAILCNADLPPGRHD